MATHEKSVVAPYFRDLQQQREVNNLGMWVFLVTETMLFAGIFMAYSVYFFAYPEGFTAASLELDLYLSTINTIVLLCSSLTMALAVRATQADNKNGIVLFLFLTLVLGSIFLGLKGVEYYHKYEHELIPGINFNYHGEADPGQVQLFISLYFAATGLHGIHMVVGAGLLIYFIIKSWRGYYGSANYDDIENVGLYWHFVDIAWVFIYPLFYLIER